MKKFYIKRNIRHFHILKNIENNAAFIGNDNRKLGEYGETLEVDNPVGSLGSVN